MEPEQSFHVIQQYTQNHLVSIWRAQKKGPYKWELMQSKNPYFKSIRKIVCAFHRKAIVDSKKRD